MAPVTLNRTKASGSVSVVIATDDDRSTAFRKDMAGLYGLVFPACTGTTVAVEVSDDGSTFAPLYDETGAAVSFAGLTSTPVAWTLPVAASPYRWFRLAFTSGQAANRSIAVCFMG